ncbi:hypothetical protein [Archangium lansingense]|uniref:Uncharacterized protein n=1 Tax=Archangium lansingense TaxID=2995310 RepID=A0ABT4AAQ7_9BACT|nr:hypothetical protein [Archangium lansinium]MCY1078700.1 hypothetical protein [Archangium lansinium]
MPGTFMKGALIEFMPTLLIPLPNVIIFQFNPETIRHVWTQPEAAASAGQGRNQNPLAVRGMPGESFSFSLVMDANDQIAEGNPLAKVSGIASRLAALEMLLYPTRAFGGGLLGSVSVSVSAGGISASLGGSASAGVKRDVPQSEVPTVLFVWGPGRIVPVRVTGLSIEEKLYDGLLNPTHAEAQLDLRVLTPEELARVSGPLKDVAKAAYTYSQVLRQGLAVANLANSVESIVGMLPL